MNICICRASKISCNCCRCSGNLTSVIQSKVITSRRAFYGEQVCGLCSIPLYRQLYLIRISIYGELRRGERRTSTNDDFISSICSVYGSATISPHTVCSTTCCNGIHFVECINHRLISKVSTECINISTGISKWYSCGCCSSFDIGVIEGDGSCIGGTASGIKKDVAGVVGL